MSQADGMRALISGGARGIGLAIAQEVTSAGGQVVIGDVDSARGEQVAGQVGGTFVPWNVTSEQDTMRAFEFAEESLGGIDSVFANAGSVGVTGPIEQTTLLEWNDTVSLLLTSVFLTVREGIRSMRPQGTGAIVVTASVASIHGGLGPHAYTAAKSAVRGLIESVAVELAPTGLRINGVAPGATVSSLSAALTGEGPDDLAGAYGRLASMSSSGVPTTAEDVAHAAVFLASPASTRINGTLVVVDGGDAVLPSSGRSFYASADGDQRGE